MFIKSLSNGEIRDFHRQTVLKEAELGYSTALAEYDSVVKNNRDLEIREALKVDDYKHSIVEILIENPQFISNSASSVTSQWELFKKHLKTRSDKKQKKVRAPGEFQFRQCVILAVKFGFKVYLFSFIFIF